MEQYFGTYEKFETPSKKEAAVLLGADNLVGDVYSIVIEVKGSEHRAWLVSRFNQRIGYFDPEFSRRLNIMRNNGLEVYGILSYVAYTETPEGGHYWGEAAVIAYSRRDSEAFEEFIHNVALKISEGVRPELDLGPESVKEIIASNGTWLPKKTLRLPDKQKGTVMMKTHRTLSEKMIEKGRAGNKGCYVVGWAFILAVVTLIVFFVYSCTTLA